MLVSCKVVFSGIKCDVNFNSVYDIDQVTRELQRILNETGMAFISERSTWKQQT